MFVDARRYRTVVSPDQRRPGRAERAVPRPPSREALAFLPVDRDVATTARQGVASSKSGNVAGGGRVAAGSAK